MRTVVRRGGLGMAWLASSMAWAALDGTRAAEGGEAAAQPLMHVPEPAFDCGRIMAGKTIRHEFRFANRGKVALQVSGVVASCGCTVAGDWTRKVEPGKEGVVPVTFTVPAMVGPFGKGLSVTSNDPANPMMQLQIRGTAWQPFEMTPPNVVFSVVEGQPWGDAVKLKIANRLDTAATLTEPQCTISGLKVALNEVVKDREYELTVTPDGTAAAAGNGQVVIRTSAPEAPTIAVPVVVSTIPAVVISPLQLLVPDGELKEPRRFQVTVRNNLPEPLTVDPNATVPPGAKVSLREVEKGKLVVVEVELPAGLRLDGKGDPSLVFRTSHAGRERVEIPFVCKGPVAVPPVVTAPQPPAPGLAGLRSRLTWAETTHDAGTVPAGKPVLHEFEISLADGGGPLEIERVDACASKGRVSNWTRRVEAGTSGSVALELDTSGLEGRVEVAFLVMAKGTTEPLAELRLKATIAKPEKTP